MYYIYWFLCRFFFSVVSLGATILFATIVEIVCGSVSDEINRIELR